ncbi:hypothetical protein [Streptomyces mangrovisoli]|uniref:Hydrophobic W protein n=1 Tax=Streptomyces mangrovisoli TaxID=1428628 RepID=A0A1J4NJX1_9ACTN|nr:hypothetical protein [Streptomyces mangrovisoli]OIJ62599.1 hypothetical protein WN71_038635 [Streptomyces mangrovisoli]
MSRDEERDDPNTRVLAVVIAADGSAVIDGVPVPVTDGEALDAAILDALHDRASRRNTPVTAAISDPAVADVTHVEVAPDGSSRLVERPPAQAPAVGPAAVEAVPAPPGADAGPDDVPPDYTGAGAGHGDGEGMGPGARPPGEHPSAPSAPPRRTAPVPGALLRRPAPGEGKASRQSDDEYQPSGLLHRPLVVGPVALGVAALVIVPLVLMGGGSDDGGRQNTAAGASTGTAGSRAGHGGPAGRGPKSTATVAVSGTPGATPSPAATSPKPKATPEHTPHAGGGKATATVTVRPPKATATVTARPAKDTAATAVNRLAGNDPGRHICYRAYVAGKGWQKPVCDGTVAGTTGQNRAVKALDIAVRGTGGVAANAFVHNPGSTDGKGVWKPHWTPNTADGKDIYIGSTAKGAPDMLGYAINIGSGGQICQVAHVHNVGWTQQGCVGPRPAYTFGGTLDNSLWLEAVRFTV